MQGDRLLSRGIEGAVQPPASEELPDMRLLAYGTSITKGGAASGIHLTTPHRPLGASTQTC